MTRAVVVGAGAHIFRAAHLPAIRANGVDVAGVYDAAPAGAEEIAGELGALAARSLDELFAIEADLAVVCVPHPAHADVIERALAAGLAVLTEKPLAARLSEIEAIRNASEHAARPVAVVQQHRFRREVAAAAEIISGGGIGRVHSASLTASYPKRSSYYAESPWRGTWKGEGGGVLLNQGLHDVDLLVHLLGTPLRVTAEMRTLVHAIEAEDTADLMIAWQGGAVGTVHVTSAASLGENRLEVSGTRGALRLSDRGLEVRRDGEDFLGFAAAPGGHFDAFPSGEWTLAEPAEGGGHDDVYADVLDALARGRGPAVGPDEARGAVEVITAAALASARGAAVALPVDPAEGDAFLDARMSPSRTGERE